MTLTIVHLEKPFLLHPFGHFLPYYYTPPPRRAPDRNQPKVSLTNRNPPLHRSHKSFRCPIFHPLRNTSLPSLLASVRTWISHRQGWDLRALFQSGCPEPRPVFTGRLLASGESADWYAPSNVATTSHCRHHQFDRSPDRFVYSCRFGSRMACQGTDKE